MANTTNNNQSTNTIGATNEPMMPPPPTNQITMDTNQNLSISGTVNLTNTQTGSKTQIMYMACSLNADTFGLNINVSVTNKELYKAHSDEVRKQYANFRDEVSNKANALGFIIF